MVTTVELVDVPVSQIVPVEVSSTCVTIVEVYETV